MSSKNGDRNSAGEATENGDCPDFKLHGHHYPSQGGSERPMEVTRELQSPSCRYTA